MQRVTIKQLENLCEMLNRMTDSPLKPYERDEDGKLVAQIGNYHISQAYGGVCVHRMANEGGGVNTPIVHGHIPKRELFEQMWAYIRGMQDARS